MKTFHFIAAQRIDERLDRFVVFVAFLHNQYVGIVALDDVGFAVLDRERILYLQTRRR